MNKLKLITTSVILATAAHADIAWQVNSPGITGPLDPTNRAETDFSANPPFTTFQTAFNADQGYFVQFLFAGADGIANAINDGTPGRVNSGFENDANFGARGDDEVVATRWIHAGVLSGGMGTFNAGDPVGNRAPQDPATRPGGIGDMHNYFVRAWAGISPDSGNQAAPGLVQNGQANAGLPLPNRDGNIDFWYYGDSAAQTYTQSPGADTVNFQPFAINSLVQTIPEPSTFALLGMGALLVAARRFRA